jgi:ferric-dicitrate binding protein FerR (iron transport regulator)
MKPCAARPRWAARCCVLGNAHISPIWAFPAAATVRGTKWRVQDRCDGTLTTVTRGVVAVRDFRLRRTILVTAGQSYLARR